MDGEHWLASGERVPLDLRSGTYRVFVRVSGDGSWLTLLHAFPTSSWDWSRVAPSLEPHFRVLAFDFLGLGDSDKPHPHEYGIGEQADLVEALWRRFGVESTGVVAHDYGATVAQELLARAAQPPAALVLLNAALYLDLARPLLIQRLLARRRLGPLLAQAVGRRTFARSISAVSSLPPDDINEQWKLLRRRNGTRVIPSLVRYVVEREEHAARWQDALERARVPLHLVWGVADPRSGADVATRVQERVPAANVVRLEGIGHYPQLEAPEGVADAIVAALSRYR